MRLKTFLASLVLVLVLGLSPTNRVHAQVGLASSVGKALAGSIVKALLGKGLEAIFGGESQLTQEELVKAIADGFNKAALDSISTDVTTLKQDLADYVPTTYADSINVLDRMRGHASNIQSGVLTHMNKANFMKLVPLYMTASNVRMAMLAEMRRLNIQDGGNQKIADDYAVRIAHVASEAIVQLNGFFLESFFDPKLGWQTFRDAGQCIHKKAGAHYYNSTGQKMANQVTKIKMAVGLGGFGGPLYQVINPQDMSTKWCPRSQGEVFTFESNSKAGSLIEVWKVSWNNIYKVPKHDLYSVLYKKKTALGSVYYYDLHKSKEGARIARAYFSSSSYPDTLGDVAGQVRGFFDVVMASGTSAEKLSAAKHSALFVDPVYLNSRVPQIIPWFKLNIQPYLDGA